ncbi:MAG: LPS export ABC transporter periplasmic protein LptC [Candidatus Hydrogenedentota bacterium]
MIRYFAIGGLIVLASGCGSSTAPEPRQEAASPVEEVTTPEVIDPSETLVAIEGDVQELISESGGLDMMHIERPEIRMYEEMSASAKGQKPTFYVRAVTADGNANGGWILTQPEAIIYGEDSEDVVLNAESGSLDDESATATLAGNVQATIGTMAVQLEEILWDNKNRLAYSDKAVTLKGEEMDLEAQGIRIEPKIGTIVLENVTGTFELGEM